PVPGTGPPAAGPQPAASRRRARRQGPAGLRRAGDRAAGRGRARLRGGAGQRRRPRRGRGPRPGAGHHAAPGPRRHAQALGTGAPHGCALPVPARGRQPSRPHEAKGERRRGARRPRRPRGGSMIARLRPIAVVAALLVAVGAPALAQEDSVLQRYDLAVENLEFAIASVPGDPVQARDELERAVNALLTLSRDTTSATLLEAMQRTFERARTAVDNESRADLAVQAAVLRGGFRRLVVDSAFTSGAAGDLQTAQARLAHIAQGMGFAAPDLEALGAAGTSLNALRLAFEAGAADAIAAELTVAGRLLATDRAAAYESLASAYGDSLLVQDSPRADLALN